MVGISDRKLAQEQASLAGFRLDERAVKILVQWLQNGADDEQLQTLFNAVDTGAAKVVFNKGNKACFSSKQAH